MTKNPDGYIAVDAGLVGKTLVEAVFSRVQALPPPAPDETVDDALNDPLLSFAGAGEASLEMQLRRAGYLARVVEAEMFEPAKQPATWLSARLREHFTDSGGWSAALSATCADLARSEPVGKPHPDDPAAAMWRVPGPGGHVRHYVARRTIEEQLQGRDRPVDGDPADLKVPWAYGFFVRACEEVLPHDAVPSPDTDLDG